MDDGEYQLIAGVDDATAGEALAFPNLVYHKEADNKWWKANATALATAKGDLGIVLESIALDNTGLILLLGMFRDNDFGFTPGEILYVGETDGVITATPPSDLGDCVRKIGYAYTAYIVYFTPDATVIEI